MIRQTINNRRQTTDDRRPTTDDRRPTNPLALLALLLALCAPAFAQTPATQPAMPGLPKGHPSLEEMMSSTKPAPPLGGGAMPGALPAGHPSLEQLAGADATTQPNLTGKLTVTLVPGSVGGTSPAKEPVTIQLIHRGVVLKKYDLIADAAGKVVADAIPVMPPVWALISVNHAGITQQIRTPELNAKTPQQAVEMKVYETTDKAPDWSVAMQHLIVQWNQQGTGLQVIEMLSASTTGDRAWLGAPAPDGKGRVTITLPLPPDAQSVELSEGFDDQSTQIVDNKLVSGGPLFPGSSEYSLSYSIPAKNGQVTLPIAAPAAVQNLMVFLPADSAQVKATGLTGGQIVDMGEQRGKVRMYRAQNLAPGATVSLAISAIPSAAQASAAAATDPSVFTPRNIALAGGFLIVLIALGMMLMKKTKAAPND